MRKKIFKWLFMNRLRNATQEITDRLEYKNFEENRKLRDYIWNTLLSNLIE